MEITKSLLKEKVFIVLTAILSLAFMVMLTGCKEEEYKPYEFAVGNGTSESPYEIATKEDLIGLQQDSLNNCFHYNEYFVLTSNIDLGGMNWTPIGKTGNSFGGVIDGKGYTISNFTINSTTESSVGLFTSIWQQDSYNVVAVKNLNISNATISVENYVGNNVDIGVLAGSISGVVENCNVNATISVKNSTLGKLGLLTGSCTGNIVNCTTDGEIKVENPEYNIWNDTSFYPNIGGVVGGINGDVINCTNKADFNEVIVGTEESTNGVTYYNGGVVGSLFKEGTKVLGCVNEGTLNTMGACGGIVGTSASNVTVENCLNKGDVASKSEVCCDVGGVYGRGWSTGVVIKNCKNEGDLSIDTKGCWWNVPVVENVPGSNSYAACWIGGIKSAGASDVIACVNTGNVSATGECVVYLGGIAGGSDGDVINCYSTGDVTGYSKYNNVMCSGIVGVVEGNTSNGIITVQNNFSTGRVLNQGRAILDAGATVAYDFVGGCFAYIHSEANVLKNNYYVTNPTSPVLSGYRTPNSWYSDEEDHATSANFVGNGGVTLESLTSGDVLVGFDEYVDETDRAENANNVWVFTQNKLPKLYWED